MTTNTKTIIRAAMAADPTITEADQRRVEAAMNGEEAAMEDAPRIVRYSEAAARLGVTRNRIKQLVANGTLDAVYLRNAKTGEVISRASGVTEASLRRAMFAPGAEKHPARAS